MLDEIIGTNGEILDELGKRLNTIDDVAELVRELSEWFVGDSEFGDELFEFFERWIRQYERENEE